MRGKPTKYTAMFRFYNNQYIVLVFAHPMNINGLKAISAPFIDQLKVLF
jgi:hypothetical protein